MQEKEHIARRQAEADYKPQDRSWKTSMHRWTFFSSAGEIRRLADAVGRYDTIERYVAACATGPLGLEVGVYLDIYPDESGPTAADDARRYWDAVYFGNGRPMDDPAAVAAFARVAMEANERRLSTLRPAGAPFPA